MPDRESRRAGGWRERAKTSRSRAVVIASLLLFAWAMNEWPAAEPGATGLDDPRPLHAAATGAPVASAGTPNAALERGDLGLAALLTQAFARESLLLQAGWSGAGTTAEQFRELYEGEPGDTARFMFARHAPSADWSAP